MTNTNWMDKVYTLTDKINKIDDEHGTIHVKDAFLDDYGYNDEDDVNKFIEEYAYEYSEYLQAHLNEMMGIFE